MDLILTIADGHYKSGAMALLNSLVRAGFHGGVICATRAADQSWLLGARETLSRSGIDLQIMEIIGQEHPSHQKPRLLTQALARFPGTQRLFFFDSDIVALAPWKFFSDWADSGIALVEDPVYGNMPNNHPLRRRWVHEMDERGISVARSLDRYYNGGFLGASRRHFEFFQSWHRMMDLVGEHVDLAGFKRGYRHDPFFNTDQDALNMAIMATALELSTVGPEGMVGESGYIMSHAIDEKKPWQKNYIALALRGVPPNRADKEWVASAMHPLQAESAASIWRKGFEIKLATAICRFVRR